MDSRTLSAFYDLSICPTTYDFTVFMALAEMARRRTECTDLRVVIVPGADSGFREDEVAYTTDNKQWRLRNILIPSCWLFHDRVNLVVCSARTEAQAIEAACTGPIFPLGYTTQRPVGDFLWSGVSAAHACGEAIPRVRPSPEASRIVRDWIADAASGRKPISITLRESVHAPVRNSNRAAWIDFARALGTETYFPIFVPDTERAFKPAGEDMSGLAIWPAAALHLDLRVALYEQCWLNLMVLNGPGVLCWLSDKARFLMFKVLNNEWVNSTTAYISSLGLRVGGQLPFATPYQRIVWEPDTRDDIEREFAAMAARISDTPTDGATASDPANAEEPMAVAVRLQVSGRLEEATAIYQDIVTKDPGNADAWHMLGIIAHQAERPDAAEKMILRAISLRPEQANYHINLGAVLRKAERRDEATNCLWRAVALAPNDAGAHADLAELLQAAGDNDKARAALLKAIRLKPGSPTLCERAARVMHALGHTAEAADLYRRAADLREAQQKDARKRRAHMPEIPVATLKAGD